MVVFLDIDGVLNKKADWHHMYMLNMECVKEFCLFCNKINANIVLTSTWRLGFITSNNKNNSKHIQQLEMMLNYYGVKIIGKTPFLNQTTRDDEINAYIKRNDIKKYIVIDDDRSLFSKIDNHYYFTNEETGFTKRDGKRCMKCI